jgi:hypothetical protein
LLNVAFISQILMNPWDPQQAPVMTLAPIANAMQQYQQQWLSQYQQVSLFKPPVKFPYRTVVEGAT